MAGDGLLATVVIRVSGLVRELHAGAKVVFGRGPGADVVVEGDRRLSRRAGLIWAMDGGVWIANLSTAHPLYAESGGELVRLPPLEEEGTARAGWFVREGGTRVGTLAMLEGDTALRLEVAAAALPPAGPPSGDRTVLPLVLDPTTKIFLVALLWCRPWLADPARMTALPQTPEIARQALEITYARHELDRFDADPAFRGRLTDRVTEHVRVLRRKIAEKGLIRPGRRLSDEVAVALLLDNSVIAPRDLRLLDDPAWLSHQENLWWDLVKDDR